jgi:coenzyme F420-reducing hydrogenase alpha subunit
VPEKKINIEYIARVEGESTLDVHISKNEITDLKLKVWEPPRFYEGFLIGRKYDEIPDMVMRICGICPVSHSTTAIRALENAMQITPSTQTKKLRRLMSYSQVISSDILHIYMLAAPDFLGYESVLAMVPKHLDLVKKAIKMKMVANELTEIVGGRAINPVTPKINGFYQVPSKERLNSVKKHLEAMQQDTVDTLKVVASLPIPEFERKTEYVCIRNPEEYTINEGRLVSTEGLDVPEEEYRNHIIETQISYSNAKQCRIKGRGDFMVGALARVNNNYDLLSDKAKEAAEENHLKFPIYNPFANTAAQALEVIHLTTRCIEMIDEIDPKPEDTTVNVKAGEGHALTEAPRGLLYHGYKVNEKGIVEKAEITTPTTHNVLSMEQDLYKMIPGIMDLPEDKLALQCEELIRAYDPCFSCSVHTIRANVKKD